MWCANHVRLDTMQVFASGQTNGSPRLACLSVRSTVGPSPPAGGKRESKKKMFRLTRRVRRIWESRNSSEWYPFLLRVLRVPPKLPLTKGHV
jgi:hypothetical protein